MFKESIHYQRAKEKYLMEINGDILNPINVLFLEGSCDCLGLFYDPEKIEEIHRKLLKRRKEQHYDDIPFTINLGCDAPELIEYDFMGKTYMCVFLRYDGETSIAQKAYKEFKKKS